MAIQEHKLIMGQEHIEDLVKENCILPYLSTPTPYCRANAWVVPSENN